jgi:DNA modification methylase
MVNFQECYNVHIELLESINLDMKKTRTSSFGTGKREGHDATAFYRRSIYEINGIFNQPVSDKELKNAQISPIGKWADRIYNQSAADMKNIPDNCVGLAFTSPPYNVGKDYDDDMGLQEYLQLIEDVAGEVYRVLIPGGRYVVNIANLGRKPYIPLHSFFYSLHTRVGFMPMGEIIWQKGKGASGNCAWGSWMTAKSPRLRDIHEYLLVFTKMSFSRPDKGESDISPTEFLDATLSIWNIPPESAQRVQHPAPFPIELAERVIQLYSYVGDVVLDPFVGSGSTCVAAVRRRRHYVGFDISAKYCTLARTRIENDGRTYMPTEKTESSELSVAFGILGIDNPLLFSRNQIIESFENTLSSPKYDRFKTEFVNPTNNKTYSQMLSVGKKLRTNYPLFSNITSLKWRGTMKRSKTASGAQDLLVANTQISLKAESDIVNNFSPVHLFISIPQGSSSPDRSENWYLKTDPVGFQELYDSTKDIQLDRFPASFPSSVKEFERIASRNDRKELAKGIDKLEGKAHDTFEYARIKMCRRVAVVSAQMFNDHLQVSLSSSSKNSIIDKIIKDLFRLDSVEYIVAGVSDRNEFAVKVPSIDDFKQKWEIRSIKADADLSRKQSVVYIFVTYRNKEDKTVDYVCKFHVEIRWSHGKFCGSPEAKLYKDFKWHEVAFMKPLF